MMEYLKMEATNATLWPMRKQQSIYANTQQGVPCTDTKNKQNSKFCNNEVTNALNSYTKAISVVVTRKTA